MFTGRDLAAACRLVPSGFIDEVGLWRRTVAPAAERLDDLVGEALRVSLVEETPSGLALTAREKRLLKGSHGSMRHQVLWMGAELPDCYQLARRAVVTGEPGFPEIFGAPYFDYLQQHPERYRLSQLALAESQIVVEHAIATSVDFGRFRSVVDVGGGYGGLAAQVRKLHPATAVTAFDKDCGSLEEVRSHGVTFVQGDFFCDALPPADAYVLKLVLHDWDDDDALRILRHCARHWLAQARVFVVESLLIPGRPSIADIWDFHLLVTIGGAERSSARLNALFEANGFHLVREFALPGGFVGLEFGRVTESSALNPESLSALPVEAADPLTLLCLDPALDALGTLDDPLDQPGTQQPATPSDRARAAARSLLP